MRAMRFVSALAIVILGFSALALATLNKYGVADVQQVTFTAPIKIGEIVLPKGEYKVEHTMQGEDHIMVFTQLHTKSPVTTKAKCQLVKLDTKAQQTHVVYGQNGAKTPVLQEIVFKGETAKHVF
jgi:hypothetical protein